MAILYTDGSTARKCVVVSFRVFLVLKFKVDFTHQRRCLYASMEMRISYQNLDIEVDEVSFEDMKAGKLLVVTATNVVEISVMIRSRNKICG